MSTVLDDMHDEERVKNAALAVEDAISERPMRLRGLGRCQTRMYWLYYRGLLRGSVVACVILYMLLALVEPQSFDGEDYPVGISPSANQVANGASQLMLQRATHGVVLTYD